ncbi:MAG: DMT family transporter [Acidobacteria bacterium]|uniref:DMT family transporter n=1 Tax=Candidatus Polarisedimenticola svalbardensis TaxID=2886004 RepID=A0A8J6XZ40_9BACT|nr:DMT family transporter [Candidatus Polarisedimenticola svalbardensis]
MRLDLLASVIIWGWTFVATRVCLQFLTPAEVLTFRLWIAIPVLAVIAFARKKRLSVSRRELGPLLAGSGLLTAHFLVQITGLKSTSATNTGWIIAAIPLVMALLSFLILGERLGKREIAGIAIATLGIVLLVSRGRIGDLAWLKSTGDWLILASCHTWALFTIATRDLTRRRDPLVVTLLLMIPAAVVMTAWTSIRSEPARWLDLPAEAVVALLFLGILGTAAAHLFWQRGVAALGASRAGIYLYLEPLATTALAVPYLHEPFGPFTAVGGGLVLLGVWWAFRKKATGARQSG